jgi:hypothetical protein
MIGEQSEALCRWSELSQGVRMNQEQQGARIRPVILAG